jgi:hypothetical protein
MQIGSHKRYRTKDGRSLWMRLRSTTMCDNAGKVIHRIVMAEEVTIKKGNEVFLEQMAALVEASEDATFRVSTAVVLQFCSSGARTQNACTAIRRKKSLAACWDSLVLTETCRSFPTYRNG